MAAGDELVGRKLGAYRIESRLGSGATGVVYRARKGEDPAVALKVLHDNIGSISGLERRFEREARVLKKLSHPNIVEITDFGMEKGRTFIAMELLEGETLEQRLERAALDPPEAITLYRPVLAALAEAHEHEVVHRDLKPANVFLLRDGGVKLLDFGLAKMLSIEDTAEEATLTRKGRIVGTPAYMAPEQITGVFIDVRADVYALGVMLYELLADRRPFLYDRRSELLRAHLLEPVPDIEEARPGLSLDPALKALLDKSLQKDAAKRYANGREMLAALMELPKESVGLKIRGSIPNRVRTEATSAVISDSERRKITESALSSEISGPSLPKPTPEKKRSSSRRDDTLKTRASKAKPKKRRALSTPALVLLALVLLAASVVLYLLAGR